MKKLTLGLCISLFISLQTHALEADKKQLIDTLLEQTGQSAVAVGQQFSNAFVQNMTMILKDTNPDIEPKAYDYMEEEITRVINEELVINKGLAQLMYPIYDKHFSKEELQKMIDINNTPFGKKVIKVMPLITQEGMQAGQQLGMALGPKIQQRIQARLAAEGIKLK
ncbi:MAG: DUF2059 domain-containing protein [Thalassotalea sp.]